ncbi:MAG: alpha/beta hydrolase [Thiogranum sp.]|nr:alpha/beta hydrolase [Thiogranum sp.]
MHRIQGPAGLLEVVEAKPDRDSPAAVAIICHPHPLHGGSLNNKVVHQLARVFGELGAISIRFNFRGVGASEGRFDEGRGELDDLLAVGAWASERWPGRKLWLAGFSFGGFIAIQGAQRLAPQWLVTVAPAINYFPDSIPGQPGLRWLLIQGEEDDVVPAAEVLQWRRTLKPQPRLALLPGAGHFFHGRLNELRQTVIDGYDADY